MRRFFGDMNPTLRGFLLIALIAGIVVAFQLEKTLVALTVLLRIAFFLALAFFVYLLWRERRGEIGSWSVRARTVFYGAAAVIVADLALFFWRGVSGLDAVGFLVVLVLCAVGMWRVWRGEHTYG